MADDFNARFSSMMFKVLQGTYQASPLAAETDRRATSLASATYDPINDRKVIEASAIAQAKHPLLHALVGSLAGIAICPAQADSCTAKLGRSCHPKSISPLNFGRKVWGSYRAVWFRGHSKGLVNAGPPGSSAAMVRALPAVGDSGAPGASPLPWPHDLHSHYLPRLRRKLLEAQHLLPRRRRANNDSVHCGGCCSCTGNWDVTILHKQHQGLLLASASHKQHTSLPSSLSLQAG